MDSNNNDPLPQRATSTDEQVHTLARQLTQQSTKAGALSVNPFLDASADPSLNPNGESFDSTKWIKTLVGLSPERYPHRAAGVSFKGLSAHGFGRPTDYQKDVGNLVPSLIGAVKETMGIGKSSMNKIQILDEFDGLVRSGEMLVVLGRPGS